MHTPRPLTPSASALSFQHYLDNDLKIRKFVPIIKDSVVYPVIYDANRTVLSLPPIINGAHSAVSAPEHGKRAGLLFQICPCKGSCYGQGRTHLNKNKERETFLM
jgi:hypothetical protein